MVSKRAVCVRRCRGFALVAVLFILVVLVTLAVVSTTASVSSLHQARNHSRVRAARMQAESGLAWMTHVLTRIELPIAGIGQELLDTVAEDLSAELDGSAALGGAALAYDGNTIAVPTAALGGYQESFRADMWMLTPIVLRCRVTGTAEGVQRVIQMDYDVGGGHPIFGFGISSKGPINLENTIHVLGLNHPGEAQLLSTAPGVAFRLQDSIVVAGDVYATDANATVTVGGDGSIGGASMATGEVWDHIHMGEGVVDFPEIDTAQFEVFATHPINNTSVTTGTKTFVNIRIKAGTNPSFSGSITINGVIFVETPNVVTFGAGTNITGVICTQEGTGGPDNVIKFEEGFVSNGVDALPDEDPFRELRTMTGSFILAPGFNVRFENESGVINGMIAAEHVKFENVFDGIIRGGIICYGSEEMTAEDLSTFTFDRGKYIDVPAGFVVDDRKLVPKPGSYAEVIGSGASGP